MSVAEDKEKGNLDVTINYIELGQAINNAIYMLQKTKSLCDIAAIKRGMIIEERKNKDRRNGDGRPGQIQDRTFHSL